MVEVMAMRVKCPATKTEILQPNVCILITQYSDSTTSENYITT